MVARSVEGSGTAGKPSCLKRRSLLPTSRPWPTCGSGWVGFRWSGSGSTPPGTATEKDVIEAEARENRLCELVDGTLVEKAMGFEESRLAGELLYHVRSYLEQNDLGICVGADGMMRIAPGLVRIPDLSFITWDGSLAVKAPESRSPTWRPTWLSKCSARGTPSRKWPARCESISTPASYWSG